MTWEPLIASTAFDGIQTDMLTAAAGILSLALIIVAIGAIYRIFTR